MKKILLCSIAALLVAFTAVFALASAGSSSDPLISLSWLTGEYRTQLTAEISGHITDEFNSVYAKAETRITSGTALTPPEGYTKSENFGSIRLYPGQTLTLPQGTRFAVKSGDANVNVTSGTVISLTDAVTSSGAFTPAAGSRYMVAEGGSAVVTCAKQVTLLIDGYYLSDGRTTHAAFADVSVMAWYYEAVDYAFTNGLFTGTSNTTFSPDQSMTRGMFVTVLYRLAGSPSTAEVGIADFPDVSNPEVYYYSPVRWAAANDIVRGYDDGTFKPGDNVTREQMAAIMYRYANWLREDLAYPIGTAQSFPDYSSISSYAVDPVCWSVDRGIINGSDGKLLPRDTATRAQVAQIVMNFAVR